MERVKKVVLFDFGGVCASMRHNRDYTYKTRWDEALSELTGIKKQWSEELKMQACDSYHRTDLLTESEFDEYLKEVLEIAEMQVTPRNLRNFKAKLLECTFKQTCFSEVADLLVEFSEKCYIGVLSNTGYIDCMLQDIWYPDEVVDIRIRSSEVGFCKPFREIYEIAEDAVRHLLDIPSTEKVEILFIDDAECNLEVPKELGWSTCLVDKTKNDYRNIRLTIEEFLK